MVRRLKGLFIFVIREGSSRRTAALMAILTVVGSMFVLGAGHASAAGEGRVADSSLTVQTGILEPDGGYEGPVPARDSEGTPAEICGPAIDGKAVWTYDVDEARNYWFCRFNRPIFADPYWEWVHVVKGSW